MPATPLRFTLFALFTLSGLSGLLYESLWAHYLHLLLGVGALAQSLVLALFMGGLALGAWGVSRVAPRVRRPLLWYALIEGGIGLYALLFHPLFLGLEGLLFDSLLPALQAPWLQALLKWGLGGVLLLPAAILLGTTFPLMSGALVRNAPAQSGGSLALLYFTNSIGAAIGALLSAFWLVPSYGLPGTLGLAGGLNLLVALLALLLALGLRTPPLAAPEGPQRRPPYQHLLLSAALATGFASFGYEIAWIREISLVLGASTQAFEIMLSAFITGLAFGALWLRQRIARITDPLRFAAHVQWLKGALALATLPLYLASYELMAFILESVQRNDGGYLLFNLTSHSIALLVMLPATFMAGMTLPLFTETLLRSGGGEASIGRVYAANTLGSILGVLAAVHLFMPLLGVAGLLSLMAAIDIGVALALFAPRIGALPRLEVPLALGTAMATLLLVALLSPMQPERLISGVYRYGRSQLEGQSILFYQDGKSATVSVSESDGGHRTIRTNGKPDASIQMSGLTYTSDEVTMASAALLPLLLRPESQRVANIGFGCGQTTHLLLGDPELTQVDTIEIEPQMVAGARHFSPWNDRAYQDPRSHIHIDDAKAFFSRRETPYEIIVSEPSNPWVSGVGNLFSREFYQRINHYLVADGLFVQWLHLYESDLSLLASVFKALDEGFVDYQVFSTDVSNLLIVASPSPLTRPLDDRLLSGTLRDELARIELRKVDDMAIRYLGDKQLLAPLFARLDGPINSDFYPYLAYRAPKTRFLQQHDTLQLAGLQMQPLPIVEMLSKHYHPITQSPTDDHYAAWSQRHPQALETLTHLHDATPEREHLQAWRLGQSLARLEGSCPPPQEAQALLKALMFLTTSVSPYLTTTQRQQLWDGLAQSPCRNEEGDLAHWLGLHLALAQRDAAGMADHAEALLSTPRQRLVEGEAKLVVGAAMLGHLALGQREAARRVWDRYLLPSLPEGRDPPLDLLLLLSHTGD